MFPAPMEQILLNDSVRMRMKGERSSHPPTRTKWQSSELKKRKKTSMKAWFLVSGTTPESSVLDTVHVCE